MEKGIKHNIPIAKPCFSGNEIALVAEVLKSGWVCQGPMVARFEETVATYTLAKHAVATSSCTTALHVAMLVNGIGVGHDVLCPSYSFIATANSIQYSGAQPQFVDIDPQTLNMDPTLTESYIESNYTNTLVNKKTGNQLKGILIVHQIGVPADIAAFERICNQHGLILMEDAACAIGSTYKNLPIGSSGNICALSFHPRKVISTGEGGMLLTKNLSHAEMAKTYRAHGASISDFARHKATVSVHESYNVLGYNYRLTDLQAALGISQMELLDSFIERRRQIAAAYNNAFAELHELEIINPPAYVSRWNYQSYPIRLREGGESERNTLMQKLEEEGISTRRGIPPIHKEPIYNCNLTLPHTESISQRSLFLPIFPELNGNEVEHVIDCVKKIVRQGIFTQKSRAIVSQ